MIEETLVIIKPDGVKRKVAGEIIRRFEMKMMEIVDIKMVVLKKEEAEKLYEMHRGKDFFEQLIRYTISGPAIALKLRGEGAIVNCRIIVGDTYPEKRIPGSIRGDFSPDLTENVVHASSSKEDAQREIKLFFE